MCECGHPLEDHSDRAVWPTCEGNNPELHTPLMKKLEDSDFTWITTPRRGAGEACECKGYAVA